MRIPRLTVLAALVAALLLIGACGQEEPAEDTTGTTAAGDDTTDETTADTAADTTMAEDDTSDTTAAAGDGEERDTVTVGLRGALNSIDGMRRGSINDIGVLMNIYDEYIRRNDDGSMAPGIIEEWEANDDATQWTFHVREGVTFHNGDPLTAEDVAFSMERAATIDEDITAYWQTVESAEAVDEYTVELTLSEPNPFQARSGELPIVPMDYFEEVGDEGFIENPVGAGPYQVVEWNPGDRLVLEAHDDYWDGEPPIENVIFRIYPDDASRAAAYRAGELDIAEYLVLEEWLEMEEDPALGTASIFSLPRNWIVIDTNTAPFDVPETRQALNHAINWDLLIEEILGGQGNRLAAMAIQEEIAHNPELEPYEYDPDRARELLAEAGYPDGMDIEFMVRLGYPKTEEMAPAIQAMLAEVGINAEINQVANADYGNFAADKNIGNIAWSGYVGDGSFIGHAFHDGRMICDGGESSTHGGFYCNEEIEANLAEAFEYFVTDFDRAQAALRENERIIYEDAAGVWGYQRPNLYGVNNDLNWEPSPFLYYLMNKASW